MPRVKHSRVSANTVHQAALEILGDNGGGTLQAILDQVLKATPGTEEHESLLCELSVAVNWVEIKAKSAGEIIDQYLDSLPDDDDDDEE
ncbi:MAG: hypothetical protein ACRD3D_17830 [Terriglobia bacterium]